MATLIDGLPEEEREERMAVFGAVIANINLDHLASMASTIRSRLESTPEGAETKESKSTLLNLTLCTVSSTPLFGAYHILFPLEFADGVRWILKVPATGYPGGFDSKAVRALNSEAMTMRLLKQDTEIPVPEVFSFDATFDNEVQCPFILMEFIRGIPLYDCWFDRSCSEDVLEQRRKRALRGVAEAMLQLNKYTFNQGGAPVFDQDGNLEIGPLRSVDIPAMLDRLRNDEDDESTIFCELGPFKDQNSFLVSMLNRFKRPSDAHDQGLNKLLRLFIEWIPCEHSAGAQVFVLSHPDLDIQNVIVSEEGEVCGLIDWDGIAAVPRCIGNERYPSWLTRDWDPMKYSFRDAHQDNVEPKDDFEPEAHVELEEDVKPTQEGEPRGESEGEGNSTPETAAKTEQDAELAKETGPEQEAKLGAVMADEDQIYENSPEELALYRSMYQELISEIAEKKSTIWDINDKQAINASVRLTRNALMAENLSIAATDPTSMAGIVDKIFKEISKVDREIRRHQSSGNSEEASKKGQKDEIDDADDTSEDIHMYEICDALGEGNLDEKWLGRLKAGFAKFCS